MAGKRQHYIPRFLQRNFLAESDGKAERTWMHRRETGARLVSIKDVGVKDFFYSKYEISGEDTLDDLITSIEPSILADLKTLDEIPDGSIIDPATAARLTTHLTLRTAHMRAVFQRGIAEVVDYAVKLSSDYDQMRKLLGLDDSDMRLVLSAIDKELGASCLEEILPRPFASRFIAFSVRESFSELYESQVPAITEALSEIAKKIPAIMQGAHNNALKSIQETQCESQLANLSWRMFRVSGAILPDCIALAKSGSDSLIPLTMRETSVPDYIILPIAHDKLLVGALANPVKPEIDAVNAASAACSDSFFIANRSYASDGLVSLIGQRCSSVIKRVVAEAIKNVNPRESTDQKVSFKPDCFFARKHGEVFSFSVSCQGFFESDFVFRLSDVLKSIVTEMNRDFPLSKIDGITFAVDYAAALENLDRGGAGLEADMTRPRSYGQGVAKCVSVFREGEWKEHLVISSSIAYALLAEDDQESSFGLQVIIKMLAGVAYNSLYKNHFDDGRQLDAISRWMHKASSTCSSKYFMARAGAFVDSGAGERYANLFIESLSAAKVEIRSARQIYLVDQSMEILLDAALLSISSVLDHAAEWLGHREGLPENESFHGDFLVDELKAYGLHSWIELFGADLRIFHEDESGITFDKIVSLSKHTERLLWTMGMFPWPTDEGGLYVSLGPIP